MVLKKLWNLVKSGREKLMFKASVCACEEISAKMLSGSLKIGKKVKKNETKPQPACEKMSAE